MTTYPLGADHLTFKAGYGWFQEKNILHTNCEGEIILQEKKPGEKNDL